MHCNSYLLYFLPHKFQQDRYPIQRTVK